MKRKSILIALALSLSICSFAQKNHSSKKVILPSKTPVDYFDLYMGTINPKTRPTVPVIKIPGAI